jgi:hypothetical protein
MADSSIQLEWSLTLGEGKRMNYDEAERACAALGPGWRLPTIQELLPLVDYSRCDPSIDIERFPDTKSGAYWTSTVPAWDNYAAPSAAWIVSFSYGNSYCSSRGGNDAFVRACRALPAGQ